MNGNTPGIFCTAAQTYEASPPVAQRIAVVERQTKETKVQVSIGIDGTGKCRAETPIHFLNHMLDVSPSAACAPQDPLKLLLTAGLQALLSRTLRLCPESLLVIICQTLELDASS